MNEIDKLLEVLDVDEVSQKIWLAAQNIIKNSEGEKGEVVLDESLADLAFRLREEIDIDMFWVGMIQVMNKAATKKQIYPDVGLVETNADWWWKYAQPVHWIISSLIAKQLSKENTNINSILEKGK